MVDFYYEATFELDNEQATSDWIHQVITSEQYQVGDITYVFCNDEFLLDINQKYLQHDTYTDIISFDYRMGKTIHGEIYISVDRVADNAKVYKVSFHNELHRVMIHGILHFLGYGDKTKQEKEAMRHKENECLTMLNN